MNKTWFRDARYGMLMQYGLYSLLERGEWVMNREEIPVDEYAKLVGRFTAEKPGFPTPIGKSFANDYLFVLRLENENIVEVWAHGAMALT